MEPKNLSAMILAGLLSLFFILGIFLIDRWLALQREDLFGRLDLKRAMVERYQNIDSRLLLVGLYVSSIVFLGWYLLLRGEFPSGAFVIFYLYSAVVAYGLLYMEYRNLFYRYRSVFSYVATAVLSLTVLYSSTVVDRHLHEVANLPAEFFPTSQTALVFLVTPMFLSLGFYVLSIALYIFIAFALVFPMQVKDNVGMSRIVYVLTLFMTFMFLTAGILKLNSDFFGEEYNEVYYQTFIEYSYVLNAGTCKNIDEDLYISHLRTGGVSVAYKKDVGEYCFNVAECDRNLGNYTDETRIHGGGSCD